MAEEIFPALIVLFTPLTDREKSRFTYDEGKEISQVFAPLLQTILSDDAVYRWGNELYRPALIIDPDEYPADLLQLLHEVDRTWNAFQEHLEDLRRLKQNQV